MTAAMGWRQAWSLSALDGMFWRRQLSFWKAAGFLVVGVVPLSALSVLSWSGGAASRVRPQVEVVVPTWSGSLDEVFLLTAACMAAPPLLWMLWPVRARRSAGAVEVLQASASPRDRSLISALSLLRCGVMPMLVLWALVALCGGVGAAAAGWSWAVAAKVAVLGAVGLCAVVVGAAAEAAGLLARTTGSETVVGPGLGMGAIALSMVLPTPVIGAGSWVPGLGLPWAAWRVLGDLGPAAGAGLLAWQVVSACVVAIVGRSR